MTYNFISYTCTLLITTYLCNVIIVEAGENSSSSEPEVRSCIGNKKNDI